jgi:hypothetical protein
MIDPVPRHLTRRITRMGGRADNGLPLFRVMRGCDRTSIIAGEERIKYIGTHDRYVFEMLMFCELTPSEWHEKFTYYVDGKKVEMNGPYPENGEYELFKVVEKVHMRFNARTHKMEVVKTEFAPLTSTLCDALIATAIANRQLPAEHRVKAAQERRAKEESDKDQRLTDRINDMGLAFEGKPFVTVPSSTEISKYS